MSHLAPVEEARKRVILVTVGQDGNAEARVLVDTLWTQYAGMATVHPWLLNLYVRRDLLSHLIGNSLGLVDWKWADVDQKNSQYLKGLFDLWKATQDQILLLLRQIRSARAAQVGVITATAPSPPPGAIDANHERYRGSPYYRTWNRGGWGW